MVDGWVRFRTLYRGRCLGNLIMCYAVIVVEAHKRQGHGACQNVDETLKGPVVQMSRADVTSLMIFV